MLRLKSLASIAFLVAATPLVSAEESSSAKSFNDVVDFVETKLIGKTLETKITTKISGGTVETEFHRRTMYTNLVRTKESAVFDSIVLIKQKNWDLDSNGKRTTDEPRIKTRSLAIRCAVYASKATGDAIGTSTVLINSLVTPIGSGSSIQMRVEGDKLIQIQSTPVYTDGFAKAGAHKPIATVTTMTFTVVEGKSQADTLYVTYDVDPKSLERTQCGDIVKFKSTEIPGLF